MSIEKDGEIFGRIFKILWVNLGKIFRKMVEISSKSYRNFKEILRETWKLYVEYF